MEPLWFLNRLRGKRAVSGHDPPLWVVTSVFGLYVAVSMRHSWLRPVVPLSRDRERPAADAELETERTRAGPPPSGPGASPGARPVDPSHMPSSATSPLAALHLLVSMLGEDEIAS